MPNKSSAIEWLKKAYHDLSSARILYAANHYTDTIGIDLQQAIEKTLKTFFAYENESVKKTHNLIELYGQLSNRVALSESEVRILGVATSYYIQDRYPVPNLQMPSRQQIKEVLDFAERLFDDVCRILGIDNQDVMK
jgi:HEPN domain-containing protein